MLNHAGTKMLCSVVLGSFLLLGCSVSDGDDQADETLTTEQGLHQTTTTRLSDGFYTEITDDAGVIVATALIDPTGVGALEIDGASTSITLDDVTTLDAVSSSVFLSWQVLQGNGDPGAYDENLPYYCAVGCGNGRCCVCCGGDCDCEAEHKA